MVSVGPIDQTNSPQASGAEEAIRTLASKEILFKAGDRKTQLYRVESGVICLYEPDRSGDQVFVDFIFPGEFVGLGFLDSHILTARAIVETSVACLPMGLAAGIVAGDRRAEAKLAEAIEREFEARQDRLSDAGRTRPVERVASLLVNLSCSNTYEGRDPHFITDCWDCGTIADLLGLSVDELADILVELEKRDLIEPDASRGLHLIDIDALEALADGPARTSDKIFTYERQARPPKLPAQCSAAA